MLKELFFELMHRYHNDPYYVTACWGEIEKEYSAPSRYYHSLVHLEYMVSVLDEVAHLVENMDALLFSIFYHDIVYKATKSDNEYESALIFKERISNTSYKTIDLCFSQILATKGHELSDNQDTNLLLDLDLAVLGTDSLVYANYAKNIRKEYKIYPDFMYRKGRKKVLLHMLEMPAIFKVDYFVLKYEAQARINLQEELKQLGG